MSKATSNAPAPAVEQAQAPAPAVVAKPNIVIMPDDVWKIKLTPVMREYTTDTKGYAGKQYYIYAYNDKAFIVHQDDKFNKDFEAGKVYKLELKDTELGYSLLAHQTAKQAFTASHTQAMIEFFSSGKFVPTEADFEDLA